MIKTFWLKLYFFFLKKNTYIKLEGVYRCLFLWDSARLLTLTWFACLFPDGQRNQILSHMAAYKAFVPTNPASTYLQTTPLG